MLHYFRDLSHTTVKQTSNRLHWGLSKKQQDTGYLGFLEDFFRKILEPLLKKMNKWSETFILRFLKQQCNKMSFSITD